MNHIIMQSQADFELSNCLYELFDGPPGSSWFVEYEDIDECGFGGYTRLTFASRIFFDVFISWFNHGKDGVGEKYKGNIHDDVIDISYSDMIVHLCGDIR